MIDDKDISDSTLRFILWRALQSYSTQELLDLLLDEDPIVRTAAAKQLHLRSEPSIFNKAYELSLHQRDEVREISAFVLGQLGTPNQPYKERSIPILIALLNNDSSHEVRAAAAAALGHLNANQATADLLKAARDPNDDVRTCVAFALGSLNPTKEIEEILNQLIADKNNDVKEWAELSLELIQDKQTLASHPQEPSRSQ
jgi:HEAT repeat protein